MRRSTWPILTVLWVAFPIDSSGSNDATKPVGARVECTLGTSGGQIRQFAFDGDPESFFATADNPGASDHFTLILDEPASMKSIVVTTGRADGADRLDSGSLEVSSDGQNFETVAKFGDGVARSEPKDRLVGAIRIRPGSGATHPLVIREIAIESVEPVATFRYPVEFSVDVADAPEMKEWAEKAARLCESWYPRINDELKGEGYKPATRISIALKGSYKGVAQASGTRITGSVKFFKEHPDDLGAMIHETCHVVQRYRGRGNPGWLVEGVADYVRFFVYEPGKAGPVDPLRAHYDGSYRTTASFLAFVAEKYDRELVLKLNRLMRQGKYKEDVFEELTGKTVRELDEEWLKSLAR